MKTKHNPEALVGKRVRLTHSMWVQGYADGEVVAYDSDRCVYFFRLPNARKDDPYYEVRIGDAHLFTVLED